jgi:hypothetical protein
MERVVYTLSEIAADALDPCEVLDASRDDTLHAAKLAEQLPAALGTQPGDALQRTDPADPGAALPVTRDRKAVSFVPDLLHQVQGA